MSCTDKSRAPLLSFVCRAADIALPAVAVASACCLRRIYEVTGYESGHRHVEYLSGGVEWSPTLVLLCIAGVIAGVGWTLFGGLMGGLPKPYAAALRGVALTGITTLIVAVVLSTRSRPELFLEGLRDWASESVSPAEVFEEYARLNFKDGLIDEAEWPESISALSPTYVLAVSDEEVRLTWGGGFGHWGVVVRGTAENRESDRHESVLRVAPTMYVWMGD